MLTKKRVLAAALETTCGTAETLEAADGAMNVFDAQMNPDIEMDERSGQASFSPLAQQPSRRGGTCELTIELHGSGEAATPTPTWASTLLPACGFVNNGSDVFSPSTASPAGGSDDTAVRTVTLGLYEDGLLKKLKGASGTAEITFTAGERTLIKFSFNGIWVSPSDTALISPTFPTVSPLRSADAGLTIASWSPVIQQLGLDLGNDVQLRPDVNQDEGLAYAIVVGRVISGSANPESTLVATEDLYGDLVSATGKAIGWTLGSGSDGNTVEFSVPAAQYTGAAEGDREGIQIDDLEFQANRNAAAGDDELTITFT